MTKNKFDYHVLDADKELLIKGLLKRRLGFSSRLMRKLKAGGGVFLNDVPAKMNASVQLGDIISIKMPIEGSEFDVQDIPIDIAYEDEDLLVVNKQPGIVVHPTKGHPAGTIANGIMHYMEKSGQSFKIRFVNRLDMDTSGLLIVAKNAFSQAELSKQMSANTIHKSYIAIVQGLMVQDSGTIDLPIGKIHEGDVQRAVHESGAPSVTHYTVLERYETGYTLVEIKLDTGRTHQIRVHLAHLGHPVIGDNLYGREQVLLIERQALHAIYLGFAHPVKGNLMEIKCDLPSDMQKLIVKLSCKLDKC
jgi:23S rRNA pseudouridine1911/1915/1917 synthase